MRRLQSIVVHMCFGGLLTIYICHFIGYFQTANEQALRKPAPFIENALHEKTVQDSELKDGFPAMNKTFYKWHPRDLMRIPLPNYLPGLKTPCFFVEDDGSTHFSKGSVRVSEKLVFRCLPQLLVIGAERCATASLFRRVRLHRHVLYPTVGDRSLKDPLFFNGVVGIDLHSQRVGGYLQLMNNATRVIYEECMRGTTVTPPNGYKECPYILVDFTARTMNHNWNWHKDLENQGLPEPNILVPHKVYHLNPKMKIVAILRNPPDRLYSDYRAYPSSHNETTNPQDFHERVVGEISVWNECLNVKRLPFNRCAYGFHWPEGFSGGTTIDFWEDFSLDRLRVGIYFAYLKDWIKVFPRNNVLLLSFEEYGLNPEELIRKEFLPFAELEDYGESEKAGLETWRKFDKRTNRTPRDLMLDKTRGILERFYHPYNLQLAELLGDNKYLWSDYLQFFKS